MAFVSDGEAPEAVEPCEGPLDDPSMFAELGRTLDAASCDARYDAPLAKIATAAVEVVTLVCMELFGAPARSAASGTDRMKGIDDIGQSHAVVPIGARQDDSERKAGPVDHDVALGSRSCAIGRVRAHRVAPLFAATEDESTQARDQSMSPARLSRSSICLWSRSQRPISCQARKRHQQVMPEQPATS